MITYFTRVRSVTCPDCDRTFSVRGYSRHRCLSYLNHEVTGRIHPRNVRLVMGSFVKLATTGGVR